MKPFIPVKKKHKPELNREYCFKIFNNETKRYQTKYGKCIAIKPFRDCFYYHFKIGNNTVVLSKQDFNKIVKGIVPFKIDNTRCFYGDIRYKNNQLQGLIVGSKFYYKDKSIDLYQGIHEIVSEYETDDPISFVTPKLKNLYKINNKE